MACHCLSGGRRTHGGLQVGDVLVGLLQLEAVLAHLAGHLALHLVRLRATAGAGDARPGAPVALLLQLETDAAQLVLQLVLLLPQPPQPAVCGRSSD